MGSMRSLISKNYNRLIDGSGLSKREIAKRIGVTETTMQRWKAGTNAPDVENIEALALLLKVDPIEFYKAESETIKTLPMSRIAKRIAAIPDGVYEQGERVPLDNDIWEVIEGMLKIRADELDAKKGQASRA